MLLRVGGCWAYWEALRGIEEGSSEALGERISIVGAHENHVIMMIIYE